MNVVLELKVREFAWLPRRLTDGRIAWLRSVLAIYAGEQINTKPGGINRLAFKGYETARHGCCGTGSAPCTSEPNRGVEP